MDHVPHTVVGIDACAATVPCESAAPAGNSPVIAMTARRRRVPDVNLSNADPVPRVECVVKRAANMAYLHVGSRVTPCGSPAVSLKRSVALRRLLTKVLPLSG